MGAVEDEAPRQLAAPAKDKTEMYGMPEVDGMTPFGLLMMLAYTLIGIGGFVLIARGLLSVVERLAARRSRDLDDLHRR